MNDGHATEYVHHPHVHPVRLYAAVWIALMVLTYITVRVSYFDFGEWNIVIAMLVASAKASLVVLFFMHLKDDERFNAVVLISAFVFLSLLFILTLADTTRRGEVDPLEKGTIQVLPETSIPPADGHGASGAEGHAAPGDAGHDESGGGGH